MYASIPEFIIYASPKNPQIFRLLRVLKSKGFYCLIEYLDKGTIREKGFLGWIVGGYRPLFLRSKGRNLKWLLHPQWKAEKEWMHAYLCSAPSLYLFRSASKPREWCHLRWTGDPLPTTMNTIKTMPHRHTHRPNSCQHPLLRFSS